MLSHLHSLNVEALVPDCYAAYRPLIADAFRFFLVKLSPARLRRVFEAQRALRSGATTACRVVAVLRECPTLHKLGQVVARDRRLDPHLRTRLQRLESMPPATSMGDVERILVRELGDPAGLGLSVGPAALAEASVAVVVPFHSKEGEGVFKVLRPGVVERLDEELEIWSQLGPRLDELSGVHGLPALDYADTLDSVRDLLSHEVRLDREQEHLRAAWDVYTTDADVHVPAVLPFCTPRVTAMERIHGSALLAASRGAGILPAGGGAGLQSGSSDLPARNPARCGALRSRHLAERVIRALVATPMWSDRSEALFHADPHAGNLIADDRGGIAILDWALVGRLSKADRESLTQIIIGALLHDAAHIARAIASLATSGPLSSGGPSDPSLFRVAVRALGAVRRGSALGLDWLIALLDAAVRDAGVRFSPDLLMFRKVLLTLEGVVADLCPGFSADGVLAAAAVRRLAGEWPARMWASPFSRAFSTHVSAADVAAAMVQAPVAALRFWSAWSREALGASGEGAA
ncbi:MAG: hypothetical protein C4547_15330 [Phycisphaerales bacterium]|nr:MAG: hypothetical protein C4547_15330 [Phycisphaerales bacterium]